MRHVLSHTSGLSGWEMPFSLEDIYDWDKSTSQLAAQAPWWPPGTASGYHAITIGHLVGEIVRRVTGKPLKQFVREEIAEPLAADFQIGARHEDYGRIAELVPPPPLDVPLDAVPDDHPMRKTFAAVPPTRRLRWRHRPARGEARTSARPTATATLARWSAPCLQFRWAARPMGCGSWARTPST